MYYYYYFFLCLYCFNSKYMLSCLFLFKVFLIGGFFLNYMWCNFILKVIKKDIYRSLKLFFLFRNFFWYGMFFLCLISFLIK